MQIENVTYPIACVDPAWYADATFWAGFVGGAVALVVGSFAILAMSRPF